jgi:hypothetical protein
VQRVISGVTIVKKQMPTPEISLSRRKLAITVGFSESNEN